MLDIHEQLYGYQAPIIFGVPAYTFFVTLGILVGLIYYFADLRQRRQVSEGAVKIVFSALLCGAIGAKIPLLFEGRKWVEILYGKSIVGGLIGGMIGVILIKKIYKIKLKLGNVIAPAIALGMAIGRLGCFFNGCCYGIIASWGFDFGDSFLRLPTQLFEVAFHLGSFVGLVYYKNKVKTPGILFKLYILAYFIFRFFTELIRENPIIWLNMSVYQAICGFGILYFSIVLVKEKSNGREQQ